MLTVKQAQTPLELGMSPCPIRVSAQHPYVHFTQVSQIFFFSSTHLRHSLNTSQTYLPGRKMCRSNDRVKDIKFNYIMFSFSVVDE